MKQAVFIKKKKKKKSFEICGEGHFETEKANLQRIRQIPKPLASVIHASVSSL